MTKKTRNKVYKYMLYYGSGNSLFNYGLCSYLNYCWNYSDMPYITNNIEHYPELMKHKPDANWIDSDGDISDYWFNPIDKETRRNILIQAIKETE